MDYKFMETDEIKIKSIKDIKYIYIYDLIDPNKVTKESIIVIIVQYGNNKSLNLCQLDKYFNMYLDKIILQYNKEKSNNEIILDESTKEILELGYLSKEDYYIDKFSKMTSFNKEKLNYGKQEIMEIKNLLFFELKQIASLTNNHLNLHDNIKGYRERFEITGTKFDTTVKYLTFFNKINYNSYRIELSNFFNCGIGIILNIIYDKGKIKIDWSNTIKTLSGRHEFIFQNKMLNESAIIYSNGNCIFYDNKILENNISLQELKKIDNYLSMYGLQDEKYLSILLPWKDYHLIIDKEEQISKNQIKLQEKHIDLTINKNNSFLRQHQFSTFKDLNKNYRIDKNDYLSSHQVILKPHYAIIETTFHNVILTNSYYQTNLEGKNFYQYFNTEALDLRNLKTRVQPIEVPSLEEQDLGYKLINNYQFKKILKRGEQ